MLCSPTATERAPACGSYVLVHLSRALLTDRRYIVRPCPIIIACAARGMLPNNATCGSMSVLCKEDRLLWLEQDDPDVQPHVLRVSKLARSAWLIFI
jgi:hypothetical protein